MPAFGCDRNQTMKMDNLENIISTNRVAFDSYYIEHRQGSKAPRISINQTCKQNSMVVKETLEAIDLQLVWVKTDFSGKDEVQRLSYLGDQALNSFDASPSHPSPL